LQDQLVQRQVGDRPAQTPVLRLQILLRQKTILRVGPLQWGVDQPSRTRTFNRKLVYPEMGIV
jgi:hypothetical protein